MVMLNELTELSNEFGAELYVQGGGGNTSAKTDDTLWIKPSGTTLASIKSTDFIPLDRKVIRIMLEAEVSTEPAKREEFVKNAMAGSVKPGYTGRPSVEAPLHELLKGKYVVHTHPAVVNGMTCSVQGKEVCERLFPEAMWVPYIDPGYTLCAQMKQHLAEFKAASGRDAAVIFLKNHGIFVNADTAAEIRSLTANVMDKLNAEYAKSAISFSYGKPDDQALARETSVISSLLRAEFEHVVSSARFDVAEGPLTPDHIVYSKSWPYMGELTMTGLDGFKSKYGYYPQVIVTDAGVYGLGKTLKKARLALDLARDGAMVKKYAQAFGGTQFMTQRAAHFIETWEVESYRQAQVA